jgi:two-component system sensor histidine kinase RegB
VVAVSIASNALLQAWLARGHQVTPAALFGVIAVDVVLLTALLALTGGPLNPFTFLYLVHVSLAAIVLSPKWSWGVTSLAVLAYFGLFAASGFSPPHDHQHMELHLQGMWVAFIVAAAFITFFVAQVRTALARRAADIEAMRELSERNQRLGALATLAGGAAHELATPLGTISIAASELLARLEQRVPELAHDARLVLTEVERCKRVLRQLSADGGALTGEAPQRISARRLVDEALLEVKHGDTVASSFADGADSAELLVPARGLALALRGLVKNALDAAGPGRVRVCGRVVDERVLIDVVDQGPGMSADVVARVGEPFFTTKPPGSGMGLGVFLARSAAEHVGGVLDISSSTVGTTVTMRLPRAIGAA